MEKHRIELEYTDTFAGDANYSWIRRKVLEVDSDISDLSLARIAKGFAGLTGIPCRKEKFGDTVAWYPHGICTVLFATFRY